LLNQTWDTFLPIDKYINSTVDNAPFEYKMKGKKTPTFPYNLKKLRKKNGGFSLLTQIPQGNTLLTQMALATIEGEKLGQGTETDLLTISYSSTDYVGHSFGIRSKELEDTYVRLDRELAKVLTYLDETIGKENYTLFLTADHAGSDNPVFLKKNKLPGNFYNPKSIKKELNAYLSKQFGEEDYVRYMDKTQVYLGSKYRVDQKILKACSLFFKTQVAGIKDVYIPNLFELVSKNATFFYTSYSSVTSGDILVNFQSGWMAKRAHGTTHGASYTSDTHVPLIWFGKAIPKGKETSKYYTIDQIAPTLSFLLDIPLPNSSNKNPIEELLE
jgi:predicted AlkP superfamily pyrophosphatase or phosphodiesterase